MADLDSDTVERSINIIVQSCDKRKYDFNEVKQTDFAVYNKPQSYTFYLHIRLKTNMVAFFVITVIILAPILLRNVWLGSNL